MPAADLWSAASAGARAALTLVCVCTFWITSGWADGYAATLLGTIACALFVSSPAPVRGAWQMVQGFILGLAASLLCFTFVLPAMDGFALLAAGLAPFLLVGAYLMARPASAGLGAGYCLMFLVSLSITNVMHYDAAALINGALAQIVGVGAGAIAFTVLLPTSSGWQARRLERALLQLLRSLPAARPAGLRHRFASAARDFILQWLSLPEQRAGERRRRLVTGIVVLEAGEALIALRRLRRQTDDTAVAAAIDTCMRHAADAFAGGEPPAAALALIDRLRRHCDAAAAPRAALTELRAALQLLELALRERRAEEESEDAD